MSFENPILIIEKAIIDRLQKAVNSGVLGYKIPVMRLMPSLVLFCMRQNR